MTALRSTLQGARNLWPVFLVAVGVVLVGTLAGTLLPHNPRATAEVSSAPVIAAVAGPGDTQVLTVAGWGVQVSLPLVPELSLLSYAGPTGPAIGLTTADLAALGPACAAANSPLGSLLRFPAGSTVLPGPDGLARYVMATVDGYIYVYQIPRSGCTATEAGQVRVNRETSIIREALGGLTPVSRL